MAVRELIIKEVIDRLKNVFPNAQIERGYLGAEIKRFPTILIFEDTEIITMEKRGLYRKQFPVIIEFLTKAIRKTDCYEKGNEILQELITAMDQDERFSGLVISYGVHEASLVLVSEDIVGISVTYRFNYVEEFKGVKKFP